MFTVSNLSLGVIKELYVCENDGTNINVWSRNLENEVGEETLVKRFLNDLCTDYGAV